MRHLFINGRYLLDQGRGAYVAVVSVTDEFVIVKPVAGGAESVLNRADFDETAILEQRFLPYSYTTADHGKPMCFLCGNYSPTGLIRGDLTLQPTPEHHTGWVIDLRLVPEEAWVKHG